MYALHIGLNNTVVYRRPDFIPCKFLVGPGEGVVHTGGEHPTLDSGMNYHPLLGLDSCYLLSWEPKNDEFCQNLVSGEHRDSCGIRHQ